MLDYFILNIHTFLHHSKIFLLSNLCILVEIYLYVLLISKLSEFDIIFSHLTNHIKQKLFSVRKLASRFLLK